MEHPENDKHFVDDENNSSSSEYEDNMTILM